MLNTCSAKIFDGGNSSCLLDRSIFIKNPLSWRSETLPLEVCACRKQNMDWRGGKIYRLLHLACLGHLIAAPVLEIATFTCIVPVAVGLMCKCLRAPWALADELAHQLDSCWAMHTCQTRRFAQVGVRQLSAPFSAVWSRQLPAQWDLRGWRDAPGDGPSATAAPVTLGDKM